MGLNMKKTNNPNKKWMQGLNRSLFKEDIQMAKKVMNRCSTSLITTEIQINTTRYYLIPAIVKKSTNNTCWRGCEENEILLHC